jgi:hypothetical protein
MTAYSCTPLCSGHMSGFGRHPGLPNPLIWPMCDQHDEVYLIWTNVQCVTMTMRPLITYWHRVLQDNFGIYLLRQISLYSLAPQPMDFNFRFDSQWERVGMTTSRSLEKGWTLIILRVWIIWNHGNKCVFDDDNPNMVEALILAGEELWHWTMARARELSYFDGPLGGD